MDVHNDLVQQLANDVTHAVVGDARDKEVLRALGVRVIEGRANYLLFRAPEALGEALRRKGAVLRSCGNYPGLDASWYRTAVRTENENRQLLALLAETLPEVAQ